MTVVVPYGDDDAARWDAFLADAPMATFLHSRRFLSHHGNRFADHSVLLCDSRSRLVGLLPAATDPADHSRVVSHPGITYGGVVHTGSLGGAAMVDALADIGRYYSERGFRALTYKAVPEIYHRRPSSDDVFGLTSLGGRLYRCDLSCAIDLSNRRPPSERRRRGARKAHQQGITVDVDPEGLDEFWPVVEENLSARHGARPTHTAAEMGLLISRFPESIEIVTARLAGELLAGVVLFKSAQVVHAQYIASTARGRNSAALDAIIEHCIQLATGTGARFFDFGISTEDEGRVLNAGLHKFKSEFGGGGVVHLFYELDL